MGEITRLFFSLVGNNEVASLNIVGDPVEPTLVVIDNKLVLATQLIQPVLTLVAPQTPAKLGELIVMEAKLTGEGGSLVKGAKIVWTVSDKGVPKQCWTQARSVIFGAGVNDTTIDVNAKLTLSYQIDTQIIQKVATASAAVKVGDGSTPTPTPTPDTIQAMVAAWAKDPSVVPADGSLPAGALALAKNFKTLSQNIGSQGLTEIRDVLLQTKSTNNDALIAAHVNPKNWDAWGKKLQDYLFAEYTAKRLVTVDQIKKMWWNISSGLWTVK